MKQVSRRLDLPYTSIGFEAECAVAIIQSIRHPDNKKFFIENRRFVLNDDNRSIREIVTGDVGSSGDFIISGDNAKEYNKSFGKYDRTFKSLECLSWTNHTSNISADFNTFRDKLLGFYSFLIENGEVLENGTRMCVFRISNVESIVISYLPSLLQDLRYTIFQTTLSCNMDFVLENFNSIYQDITGVPLRQFPIPSKFKFEKYQGLFNYLVHTFLEIYKNKNGKLYDSSVDRKAFVPLALRNRLDHILKFKQSKYDKFAHLLSERILELENIELDESDKESDDWIKILEIYIHNLPKSLDITPVSVRDEITFEIRCFERRFLTLVGTPVIDTPPVVVTPLVTPNRRRVVYHDDDDDDGKGLKKTRKQRRRTYKKRNHKHTNNNNNKNKNKSKK